MAPFPTPPGVPGVPAPVALAATRHGAGRPVVLVHGFTQTAGSWRALAQTLGATHEVIAVDLPGHGASAPRVVADLAEAARLLGQVAGWASYVGYSLGGRVCLTLALAAPELVERLVLVGATPGIASATERAARRDADAALANRLEALADRPGGLEEFLDEWLAGPLFSHLGPEAADRAARAANDPAHLARALRALGTGSQPPAWDRLGALAMPVLVVAGGHDEKFSAIGARTAAAIGANARFVRVPGVGHAVPFEAPDAFATLVAAFLDAPAALDPPDR